MGTYGLVTGAWALVASEGAFALGSLIIVARALPARRAAAEAARCAALVAGAYAVLTPGTVLLAATAASLTARAAQIRACLRSGTAAGVSALAWLLLAAANTAWAAAGLLRADAVFAWSSAAGALASLAVVATCSHNAARGAGPGSGAPRGRFWRVVTRARPGWPAARSPRGGSARSPCARRSS